MARTAEEKGADREGRRFRKKAWWVRWWKRDPALWVGVTSWGRGTGRGHTLYQARKDFEERCAMGLGGASDREARKSLEA